ncbi:hypothetical protein D1007_51226 [Hordeum vulgare]|nr:hypothetical protein D1007_51226 [Hordeum vulgare]
MCDVCKELDHPTVLCPDQSVGGELIMYGHGIEGLGLFHMKPPEVEPSNPYLLATVSVLGKGAATSALIAAELNQICKVEWNWQVSDLKFSVIFPKKNFGMCTWSMDITLALNKLVVGISAPRIDSAFAADLDTA